MGKTNSEGLGFKCAVLHPKSSLGSKRDSLERQATFYEVGGRIGKGSVWVATIGVLVPIDKPSFTGSNPVLPPFFLRFYYTTKYLSNGN